MRILDKYQRLLDHIQMVLIITLHLIRIILEKIWTVTRQSINHIKNSLYQLQQTYYFLRKLEKLDKQKVCLELQKHLNPRKERRVKAFNRKGFHSSFKQDHEEEEWDDDELFRSNRRIPTRRGRRIVVTAFKNQPDESDRHRWGGLSMEQVEHEEFMKALDEVENLADPVPLAGIEILGSEIEKIILQYEHCFKVPLGPLKTLIEELMEKSYLKVVTKLCELISAQNRRYRDMLVTFARMHNRCDLNTERMFHMCQQKINTEMMDPEIRYTLEQIQKFELKLDTVEERQTTIEQKYLMVMERIQHMHDYLLEATTQSENIDVDGGHFFWMHPPFQEFDQLEYELDAIQDEPELDFIQEIEEEEHLEPPPSEEDEEPEH